MAEHLIEICWGVPRLEMVHQLSVMLSVCLQCGIIPESFRSGMFVPLALLEKAHTTFCKLMAMFVLEECGSHAFDDAQFGFVRGRGIHIAISLTKYVILHIQCEKRQPYLLMFLRCRRRIRCNSLPCAFPESHWRTARYMLEAYVPMAQESVSVQVRRGKGALGKVIRVMKGTRQGGLSSPFLFNLFFQDMARELSG